MYPTVEGWVALAFTTMAAIAEAGVALSLAS